nr:uncharacterized protein CTRU02_11113 [Colletotrichum truncatum]KAF6786242.1 hypothetical protein CTRU02_11113 [Colletotrichum truncatum]
MISGVEEECPVNVLRHALARIFLGTPESWPCPEDLVTAARVLLGMHPWLDLTDTFTPSPNPPAHFSPHGAGGVFGEPCSPRDCGLLKYHRLCCRSSRPHALSHLVANNSCNSRCDSKVLKPSPSASYPPHLVVCVSSSCLSISPFVPDRSRLGPEQGVNIVETRFVALVCSQFELLTNNHPEKEVFRRTPSMPPLRASRRKLCL